MAEGLTVLFVNVPPLSASNLKESNHEHQQERHRAPNLKRAHALIESGRAKGKIVLEDSQHISSMLRIKHGTTLQPPYKTIH